MPTALAKCIVSPHRLARIIEWKKFDESIIVALDMTRERIGLASVQHSSQESIIHPIKPIQIDHNIKRSSQIDSFTNKLQNILKIQKVDGIVVHWPLLPNGSLGKSAGRTLFFLDRLAEQKVISKILPVALWDARKALMPSSIVHDNPPPDKWGRSEAFILQPSMSLQNNYVCDFDHGSPDSSDARVVLHDYLSSYFEENNYILGEDLDEEVFTRNIDEYEAHPYFQESLL